MDMQMEPVKEYEEPPGHGRPPFPWQDVPLPLWNDWRWQLRHRLSTAADLAQVINLSEDERMALATPGHFRTEITPYFASLMDAHDTTCPIRRQVVPTTLELTPDAAEMADSLAEDAHSPVPGLVHRYPDRALMLVTTQCASYCRFCTRSRVVGDARFQFGSADYERQLAYIAATPAVRDVLISGGDPLMLHQPVLERLLGCCARFHNGLQSCESTPRRQSSLPQRTLKLSRCYAAFHPLWMNIPSTTEGIPQRWRWAGGCW